MYFLIIIIITFFFACHLEIDGCLLLFFRSFFSIIMEELRHGDRSLLGFGIVEFKVPLERMDLVRGLHTGLRPGIRRAGKPGK